jgi:stage V sporulation protein R
LVGQNWVEAVHYAAYNFKDESFILQYLTPNLIRKMRLFALLNESGQDYYEVKAISNDEGYKQIRNILSHLHSRAAYVLDIQITEARMKGDRRLTLQHTAVDNIPLEEKDKLEVMKHRSRA